MVLDNASNHSMDMMNDMAGKHLDDEINLDANGMGCVRVIDNVQFGQPQGIAVKPLYALIITPTRELAVQIENHLCKATKYTDIRVCIILYCLECRQKNLLNL